MKDYKIFTHSQLESNNRLRETILEVNRVVIWILSAVVIFYLYNTFIVLELPLDNGFYRLLLLLAGQVISISLLRKQGYKILAFYNIAAFSIGFFLYPFLNLSRRFEENIYMPLVLLIFGITLPILFYNTKKDKIIIGSWLLFIISCVVVNLFYQFSISSVANLKFFTLFIDHPMSIIGFLAAIIFLGILIYKFKDYNNQQHDTLIDLNNAIQEKLIQIFELNNEKETQNEELKSIQEEMLAIKDELENKIKIRSNELKTKQKEIVRYAFMNSHILRAPIARIKGLMYLYETAKSKDAKEKVIQLLKNSINELDHSSQSINEIYNDSDNPQLKTIEQKVIQLYGNN